jgi:hypothetical protein
VPFIQSAKVGEGVGLVSFWYRAWETDGDPAGELKIYAAPSETTPMEDWALIDTIPVTVDNTAYNLYQKSFYEKTNFFVRVVSSTNSGMGRVCIDNMLVAQPLVADFEFQDIAITPLVPLSTNAVHVSAEIGRFVLDPNNFQARLYYHVGTDQWANVGSTWNPADYRDMSIASSTPGSVRFETDSPIPAQSVDSVVQYYVEVTFDGTFAWRVSPKKGRVFSNPSWYEPVNLNSNKSTVNPYYFVFSCPTNAVWINEFDYMIYGPSDGTNEFVELAGAAGTDLSGWTIELLDAVSVYDYHTIPTTTLIPGDTNNFGFYIWGDSQVAGIDGSFTNQIDGNLIDPGRIALKRSMGAWVDRLSYGTAPGPLTNGGYRYVGSADNELSSMFLAGTGGQSSDFYWTNYTGYVTNDTGTEYDVYYDVVSFAGRANGFTNHEHQILAGAVLPGPSITLVNLWTASTNAWIVFRTTGYADEINPLTMYTTNLVATNWLSVSNASHSYNAVSSTYTQRFDKVDASPVFYRVTSTNDP